MGHFVAANLYCTGPVHIYARVPVKGAGPRTNVTVGGNGSSYVGTCEVYPKLAFEQTWIDVFNDLGSTQVAFDKMATGEKGIVECDLNRFDYNVVNTITNYPRNGRNNAGINPRGSMTRLDRGAFALANGLSVELWLYFSFFGSVNALDYPELIPGYYFPACVVTAYNPDPIGTQTHKIRLMIEPLSVWTAATGGFTLYSNSIDYFANLPPIS